MEQAIDKLKKYGNSAPSHGTVLYNSFNYFVGVLPPTMTCPGRPTEVSIKAMVTKIFLADRRVKIREIADALHISTELTEQLSFSYFYHNS